MKRKLDPDQVKRLRIERGWTQEELAIASGLSLRTIQRMESNGEGTLETIKSISSALQADMQHLMEDVPGPRGLGEKIGILSGCAGFAVGVLSAVFMIHRGMVEGDVSAFEAGVSFGILGLLAGLSSALMGWHTNRNRKVLKYCLEHGSHEFSPV